MSYFSETARFSDLTLGIDFYRVVADYEEHFEDKKEELIGRLKDLIRLVFTKENLMVSVTCDEKGFEGVFDMVERIKDALPATEEKRPLTQLTCVRKNEGFMDASKVQYVAKAGNFKNAGYAYSGVLKILKVILSYDYLWQNVRVKGGAYGCGGGFMRNGNVYFSSFRDPNLEKTKEVYDKMPEYLRAFTADEREIYHWNSQRIGYASDAGCQGDAFRIRVFNGRYLRGYSKRAGRGNWSVKRGCAQDGRFDFSHFVGREFLRNRQRRENYGAKGVVFANGSVILNEKGRIWNKI